MRKCDSHKGKILAGISGSLCGKGRVPMFSPRKESIFNLSLKERYSKLKITFLLYICTFEYLNVFQFCEKRFFFSVMIGL